MVIGGKILDDLSAQAKESPRLRKNLDLRNSPEVCLEPGSVLFESKDGKYEALGEDEVLPL